MTQATFSSFGISLSRPVGWLLKFHLGALVGTTLFVLGFANAARSESFYDRHVFFDNSPADRSYYQSAGLVTPPSKLEMEDFKLPVETNHFHSPPNALCLKWKSMTGGDWQMTLKAAVRYGWNSTFDGDTISFWCLSDSEISPEESPRITLQDRNSIGSGTIDLLADYGKLPAGKWVRISIPFEKFKPLFGRTEDLRFDPIQLDTIWLQQGLDDGKPHTIYIDDIAKFIFSR